MLDNKIILELNNFITIYDACKDAHRYKRMVGIVGDPGYGKSTALETYQLDNQDCVVYVDARLTMNAKLFYSTIYNTISGESYDPTVPLYFLIRKAANKFNEDSRNKLLIIDEAGNFSSKMLEFLHEFRDLTATTTGIILAGPNYFEENIKKWNRQMVRGIPEVYSRIGLWISLKAPTREEKIALIRAYGINDEPFEKYVLSQNPEFRTTKNIIDTYLIASEKENGYGIIKA